VTEYGEIESYRIHGENLAFGLSHIEKVFVGDEKY